MIRKARASDARSIASIYNQYILNSTVTFEEKKVDSKTIVNRIPVSYTHLTLPTKA